MSEIEDDIGGVLDFSSATSTLKRTIGVNSQSEYISDISECPSDLTKGVFLKPLYYVLNNG